MPYSIASSTKILTLATAPFLFILIGAVCLWICYSARSAHFTLHTPRKKRYTLLPQGTDEHIQQHNHQKDLIPCLSLYHYGKVIVELEKKHKHGTVFMVLEIWPIALWNSYLFFISVNIWAIFSLRDRQQITFAMLNRPCLLSVK